MMSAFMVSRPPFPPAGLVCSVALSLLVAPISLKCGRCCSWGTRSDSTQLNQQDGEVVDEEQCFYEGQLDDVLLMELVLLLQEMDAVKQPETKDEDKDEGGDEGAEDKDTREGGGGVAK